jgi:hypothetical protein
MAKCANCGYTILTKRERDDGRLGSGREPTCICARPSPVQRRRPRIEPTQNVTYVAPAPSIADQLAVLARLFREGSITKKEFEILKSRLISGGEL